MPCPADLLPVLGRENFLLSFGEFSPGSFLFLASFLALRHIDCAFKNTAGKMSAAIKDFRLLFKKRLRAAALSHRFLIHVLCSHPVYILPQDIFYSNISYFYG